VEVIAQFSKLASLHPRLLWGDIATAAATVCQDARARLLTLSMHDVPGFAEEELQLQVDTSRISPTRLARFRQTYDVSRRIELAAIAVAGLALYHGGGHEIRDVASRGTGADYLVDANSLLEVAGRSRRQDLAACWQDRLARLQRHEAGFYLCVVEFETPAGRLAYYS